MVFYHDRNKPTHKIHLGKYQKEVYFNVFLNAFLALLIKNLGITNHTVLGNETRIAYLSKTYDVIKRNL